MSDSDTSSDDVELDLNIVLLRRMTVKQLRKHLGTRKLSQQGNKFTSEQRLVAYFTVAIRPERFVYLQIFGCYYLAK